MTIKAIVGGNWGDEGKGKMVDHLAKSSQYVVRYQGGNNAGHTIINDYGKFQLHLLPSGVFYPGVTNVLASGVALNIEAFLEEYQVLVERGVKAPRILISQNAQVLMPHHILLDQLEEDRLAKDQFGSTRSGIAPFYMDKYGKVGIRVSDLYHPESLMKKINRHIEKKNILMEHLYKQPPLNAEEIYTYLLDMGEKIKAFVGDCNQVLNQAHEQGADILLEGQLGALKDSDHGIYPMTTSSSTLASFAATSCGLPAKAIEQVITVVKAYSTAVGGGAFVSEIHGDQASHLRAIGGDSGEYGATTGRPRRVGWFDAVASRYGCQLQGSDEVVLSLLDVLSAYETLRVCVAYDIHGQVVHDFPSSEDLKVAKPIWETLEGWQTDISHIRAYEDLPREAKAYVTYLEKLIGYPIKYVSVGPKREDLIIR